MKKSTRFFSTIIGILLMLSLFGCSNGGAAPQNTTTNNSPEVNTAKDPVATDLSVTYSGSTEAGTLIDKGCDGLVVTVLYSDGSKKQIEDYTVTNGGTLAAAKTMTITVSAEGSSKQLQIRCTTMPEPIVYTGSGDSVLDVDISEGYVLHITGNQGSRHFAVKGYSASGSSTELFVNTTNPYDGITLDSTLSTTVLEISSSGDWTIELVPLISLRTVSEGETIEGNGDEVIMVVSSGSKAVITGNEGARHFAVRTYSDAGRQLLVNTTDPYSGTVMIKDSPYLLEITSQGHWSVTF